MDINFDYSMLASAIKVPRILDWKQIRRDCKGISVIGYNMSHAREKG